MPSALRATAIAGAVLLSGAAGLVVGYLKGAEDWAGYTSATDAGVTVLKLTQLRANNFERVIGLLEIELDGHIARRKVYESGLRPIEYVFPGTHAEKVMREAEEYRRSYPSPRTK